MIEKPGTLDYEFAGLEGARILAGAFGYRPRNIFPRAPRPHPRAQKLK